MNTDLEQIVHKVDMAKERNPALAEVVGWVGDLLSETVQSGEKYFVPALGNSHNRLPDAWFRGQPLLKLGDLNLDWEQAGTLCKRLVRLVENKKQGRSQIQGLKRTISKDQETCQSLLKAVLASDFGTIEATAKALGADPSVLILLFRMSLRPALLKVAQAVLDRFDLSSWSYGHCPVCGSSPKLASLSMENGKRQLHCSLCETAWSYPRLQCPFCENDDPKNLEYMRSENEEDLRVDFCKSCGKYIKTIDLRKMSGPIIVPLDDVATLHLDFLALKATSKNQVLKARRA